MSETDFEETHLPTLVIVFVRVEMWRSSGKRHETANDTATTGLL